MRKFLLIAAIAASSWGLPAIAQSNVDARVGKLESEMRAVQRKVFPGGAGTYLEPQITPGEEPIGPGPGTPATSAVIDLSARVTSLEAQMATLTGQIEQSQYRLRQLEESFAAYRKATDAKLSEGAPTPAMGGGAPEEAPVEPRPAARSPVAGDPGRAVRLDELRRPATDDPVEDAYLQGYRLWAAKLYPEADTQLKKVVTDHPRHRRASYAQNLLGRSYLDQGKPSLASIAFYDNYKKMPDGERAPDSLYFLGQALMKLNKAADACKVYGELTDVYGAKIDATLRANVAKARTAAKCK